MTTRRMLTSRGARVAAAALALLALLLLTAAGPAPAPAAGGPPMPTLPATQGPKRTPGPAPTDPAVEQATMFVAWQGRDLLVSWYGDGTELVLLQQDGTYALIATTPGIYTIKGGGADQNTIPLPGDVLVIHGRSGQLLAYFELPGYPIVPRAILPIVVR